MRLLAFAFTIVFVWTGPESLTTDNKIQGDVLYGISHCAFLALQKFHSDHCLKHFCEFPNNISFSFLLQKSKPTQSATSER